MFLPLENRDIQLLVLGLGVGNTFATISEFVNELKKNEDKIRALKILSEHSLYIGVRGSISAEILDRIGIHNHKMIGCPSFYELNRKKICS